MACMREFKQHYSPINPLHRWQLQHKKVKLVPLIYPRFTSI